MKRHAHNLSHTLTMTAVMGLNYPTALLEGFPGDSFRYTIQNLSRFLAQVAPTMHNVNIGIDTYEVPLRQLCDKLGIDWDAFLTGGEDGMENPTLPTITIPDSGWETGSLADFLGYPTNYIDPDTGNKIITGAGLTLSAMPIICYMWIIDNNYRDQNFIKKLDLTKYEEFINGTYVFEDASGDPLGYDLLTNGIFPKAWSRDYFGRALPNTQRGPQAQLPISGTTELVPSLAPVRTETFVTAGTTSWLQQSGFVNLQFPTVTGMIESTELIGSGPFSLRIHIIPGSKIPLGVQTLIGTITSQQGTLYRVYYTPSSAVAGQLYLWRVSGSEGLQEWNQAITAAPGFTQSSQTVADLSGIEGINSTAASIIAFRLAARMQRFGEVLQQAGARAVEFTLAMFGVRIPDARVQRPIFHGSFRLPVVFSEVLQTSSTDSTSPQGNLAGHGITGGTNQSIHIKCLEHCYIMSIMHIMPQSQYQNTVMPLMDRISRFDMPNPIFMHVGEQPIKRKYIYPNSTAPEEAFGFTTRYAELSHVPSRLHGHMKDTFLHWTMARLYNKGEPVLSAAWRYEKPTNRSFSVRDEDQMQICLGFTIKARRVFAKNPSPGIHIV